MADPLASALASIKKKLGKSPVASAAAKMEKSLAGKDDGYKANLAGLTKAIAAEKKSNKDKSAVKDLEALEKSLKDDKGTRFKPVDASDTPS